MIQEFLLRFFEDTKRIPNWKNVATTLIEEGECILAGSERPFAGGIGNFIEVNSDTNLIECVKLKFDLESFKSSQFYKDYAEKEIIRTKQTIKQCEEYLQHL